MKDNTYLWKKRGIVNYKVAASKSAATYLTDRKRRSAIRRCMLFSDIHLQFLQNRCSNIKEDG